MSDDWYKRNPADFLDGVAKMSLEMTGAYTILLDTMYLLNRPLHDDAAYLAGILRVTTRKARSLRDQLVDLNKLIVVGDKLDNVRAKFERENRTKKSRTCAEAGRTGGEKSGQVRKLNALAEANALSETNQIREEEIREEEIRKKEKKDPPAAELAFEGSVIRLTRKDFDRWEKAFTNLNLYDELRARDLFLENASEADRKRWYMSTSAYLANKNREAAITKKSYAPRDAFGRKFEYNN